VRQFLDRCEANGAQRSTNRPSARSSPTWSASDAKPPPSRSRQLSSRRFSAWLAAEDEIDRDELPGLKPPKLDQKAVNPLTDDQLRALIDACKGKEYRGCRDEALISSRPRR
jgi:site-specific recombinase XerD